MRTTLYRLISTATGRWGRRWGGAGAAANVRQDLDRVRFAARQVEVLERRVAAGDEGRTRRTA